MAMRPRSQRAARRTEEPRVEDVFREPETPPEGDIEIQLEDDDLPGGEVEVSLASAPIAPSPAVQPTPSPAADPSPGDDAVALALAAQRRAEQLQADAVRERDAALRQAQEHQTALARERTEREDAEYNSVLTAIAAEEASIEKAEADYAAAATVGDWATAAKAQRAMAVAGGRLDRLEDGKRSFDSRREASKNQPERPAPVGDPVETQIAAMQMPEEGKAWLRSHRDYMTDARKNAKLQSAHWDALDAGPIGTPKYIEALETSLGLAVTRPAVDDKLHRTQEPQRRSIPMTAPVSREVPTGSGARPRNSMRLTEAERQAARDSIPDRPDLPKLTNAQKEYMYAKNKAKYEAMRASGEYTDQRRR